MRGLSFYPDASELHAQRHLNRARPVARRCAGHTPKGRIAEGRVFGESGFFRRVSRASARLTNPLKDN
jgi:hypothetical protein